MPLVARTRFSTGEWRFEVKPKFEQRQVLRLPAYYLATPEAIHDPEGMKEYAGASTRIIESFGGRYLANRGVAQTLAGDWRPPYVVLLEFPTMELMRQWYESAEYRPWRELRERSMSASIVVFEGLGR